MVKLLSCTEDSIQLISPQEVWDHLRGDTTQDYLLLDVRTKEEYTEAHLPGTYLIPLHELDKRYGELDRQKKIITYCRSGKRSMGGAILLCNLGFPVVYSMEGGILAWPYQTLQGPPEDAAGLFKDIKEVKELLLVAMQMESASQSFYQKASQKMHHTPLTQLLNELASREEKHREHLYAELKKVWPQVPPLDEIHPSTMAEGAVAVPQVFAADSEELPQERIDILEFALEKECRAFDLYHSLSARVPSPLKEVFLTLAQEERTHIDELSKRI